MYLLEGLILAPNHPQVSTLSLFGYMITVLLWELEFGLVALQIFSNKKPGFAALSLLLILSGSMTVFLIVRGKRDFARLRFTKGRIELSGIQATLVTIFVVLFGGTLGLIAMSIVNQ
ncbi:hypothetical protein [Gimesia aquarii]|uniref:Uncharacterized protein n=1 Tax=Gimesia aquarii TaxID=2527964 RepID=A0A517VTH9_9PLAN|nr:hypothetical protein [Gimesia aquarii]QDT96269.1 hypothetical protein V144x_17230 [Gimesia aquarii]